jgi:hypothetical protein
MLCSHLTTLRDDHVLDWLVAGFGRACVLNLANNVKTINHFAEHNMLVVQEWCWNSGDEELRSVSVGSRVLQPVNDEAIANQY